MTTATIAAGNLDLQFMQGSRVDASTLQILLKSGDPPEYVNLSGWSARAVFKAKIKDQTAQLDLKSSENTILLNNPTGAIVLIISEQASSSMTKYAGVWNLELTSPDGITSRLLQGNWTMSPDVSHD
jgi:hypothetical protein